MSELIIINIKCLPTDDWDGERPNRYVELHNKSI